MLNSKMFYNICTSPIQLIKPTAPWEFCDTAPDTSVVRPFLDLLCGILIAKLENVQRRQFILCTKTIHRVYLEASVVTEMAIERGCKTTL